MLDCISVENMRISDCKTIETMVPGLELIRRAAESVFHAVPWHGRIAILAGSGNNGADGFALACILKQQGKDCVVFAMSQRLHPDCAYYAEKAAALGVEIRLYEAGTDSLNGFDFVVDCLLGTGFQGNLRDNYRSAIAEINGTDAYVVSVDINSGMNGDTGEAEIAVCSDLTVTIGFVKRGLITAGAGAYIKRLICSNIGIVLAEPEDKICDELEWQQLCSEDDWTSIALDDTMYHRCPDWLTIK